MDCNEIEVRMFGDEGWLQRLDMLPYLDERAFGHIEVFSGYDELRLTECKKVDRVGLIVA